MDPPPLRHQPPEIERGPRACTGSDHDQPPTDCEPVEIGGEIVAAHQLEDHVVLALDARARSERLEALGAVPRGGGDPRACGQAELDPGDAHPAGCPVHQQAFAVGERRVREERVVRGCEHLHEAARLHVVERVGNVERVAFVHRHELGLPASSEQPHRPVTDREAEHARPDRGYGARALEPGDVGRSARRRRVAAGALRQIGAVDAGAGDANQQLAVTGDRVGTLLDHQPFVRDDHRQHAVSSYGRERTALVVAVGDRSRCTRGDGAGDGRPHGERCVRAVPGRPPVRPEHDARESVQRLEPGRQPPLVCKRREGGPSRDLRDHARQSDLLDERLSVHVADRAAAGYRSGRALRRLPARRARVSVRPRELTAGGRATCGMVRR